MSAGNTHELFRPTVRDTVTIPINTQVPTTGLGQRGCVGGIFCTPAALTSTTMGFDVSYDGGATWVPLKEDSGSGYATATTVAIAVAADECHKLPEELAFAPLWRFNTGSNEEAARTIYVFRGA